MISGNDVQSLVGDDDIATDRTSEEQTVVGRRAAEPSASGDSSRDGAPRIATDRRTPMSGSSAVSPPQADTRDAGLKAVGKPGPAEHTDNEGTGEGRTSNPGTVLARQKERFGGMKAGSAFFGWLTATGTTVILLGLVAAIAGAVGSSMIPTKPRPTWAAARSANTDQPVADLAPPDHASWRSASAGRSR